MNPLLLQKLGLTNLTDEQIEALNGVIELERATKLAELTPTGRHLLSIEEQNRLRDHISQLQSENAKLQQIRKSARLTGFVSTCSLTIGAGLISTYSSSPEEIWFGIGWGLIIVGVGILAINSLFGY